MHIKKNPIITLGKAGIKAISLTEELHDSCNMGTRDLPDMYTLSPLALDIHIRQITLVHVTTIKYDRQSNLNHSLLSENTYSLFL